MDLTSIKGIGRTTADALHNAGITDVASLAAADDATLAAIEGLTPERIADFKAQAGDLAPQAVEAASDYDDPAMVTKRHDAFQPVVTEEPEDEPQVWVEVTFLGMPGYENVDRLIVKRRTLLKGVPVRMERGEADLIVSRPQYEFTFKGL
jgi:hypothetical protein